jgi:hypothetical protein
MGLVQRPLGRSYCGQFRADYTVERTRADLRRIIRESESRERVVESVCWKKIAGAKRKEGQTNFGGEFGEKNQARKDLARVVAASVHRISVQARPARVLFSTLSPLLLRLFRRTASATPCFTERGNITGSVQKEACL